MSNTPLSDAALEGFDDFVAAVRARLVVGKRTYGDSSFERPLAEVARELQCEALDFAGWGWIMYTRALKLEEAALEASTPHRNNGSCAGFVVPVNGNGHHAEV